MAERIVVVTDSTASLPADLLAHAGVRTVPVQVVVDGVTLDEGEPGADAASIARALAEHRAVSTSRPPPAVFAETYRRIEHEGATQIVSVHLSAEVSGTVESAQLAARSAAVPITVVDARQVGPGTGFAAIAAATVVDQGGSAEQAGAAARWRGEHSVALFYVDTLEYLRRGGRIGAGAALVGGALSVKPLLGITAGRVGVLERVRTSGRALSRLVDLATAAVGESPVEVCVSHVGGELRAAALIEQLAARLADQVPSGIIAGELSAVLGAHAGPGTVSVVVSPLTGGPQGDRLPARFGQG